MYLYRLDDFLLCLLPYIVSCLSQLMPHTTCPCNPFRCVDWMAPELFLGRQYNETVDVFSFGADSLSLSLSLSFCVCVCVCVYLFVCLSRYLYIYPPSFFFLSLWHSTQLFLCHKPLPLLQVTLLSFRLLA